jgi:hypothetical protein
VTVATARAHSPRGEATRVESQAWFRWVARGGLAARGCVYVVLTVLAFDIATSGHSPAQTSGTGALQEVARQPAGPAMLVVLAAGFAAYGLWRLVQAISGSSRPGARSGVFVRIGWAAIAGLYAVLSYRAVVLLAGSGTSGGGGGKSPEAWAARVLRWPAGQELLGAAGLVLLGAGAALAAWGLFHDYDEQLRLERLRRRGRVAVKVLGAVGEAARGAIAALVGVYALDGAIGDRPSQVKTSDQALEALVRHSGGAVLLAVVAAGLACFALYSFAEAWLRDL